MEASQNFSGAELESAVQESMYEAYYSDEKEVKPHHLIVAMTDTVPLAQTTSEKIELQRAWARLNCRMAQKSDSEKVMSIDETRRVVNL